MKKYFVIMGIGAVLGIMAAEMWRRAMLGDSYANYLPPATADAQQPTRSSSQPLRRATQRLWAPVAAYVGENRATVRRIRTGAPRPSPSAAPLIAMGEETAQAL